MKIVAANDTIAQLKIDAANYDAQALEAPEAQKSSLAGDGAALQGVDHRTKNWYLDVLTPE